MSDMAADYQVSVEPHVPADHRRRKEDTPIITVNCEVKDSRIIVLIPEGKVEIHEVPDGVNIADLLKAALSGGVDALKAAAEKVHARVVGPMPITDDS